MKRRARLLGAVSIALGVGCARPSPVGVPVPDAVDSRIEWVELEPTSGRDARGRDVDEIEVRGGDIVRITPRRNEPLEVGERVRNGSGSAETWRIVSQQNGAIVVRATLLGTAILVPKGAVVRAHRASTADPGYAWFDHEARVNAWAEGPLPAAFPAIAPPERLDYETLASLDRVLAREVAKAKDRDRARAAATAIRRVAGLRAIRALRAPSGFPYFYDDTVTPDDPSHKSREVSGKKTWLVTTVDPLAVTVEGPRLLHVWSYGVRRDEDEVVQLRVLEGPGDAPKERAVSSGSMPRARNEREDGLEIAPEQADTVPLRRALVHVPPGKHTYRVVVKGGNAYVAVALGKPVVHLGDAFVGIKDESRQLAKASAGCSGSPGLCALVMALAGDDLDARWTPARNALDDEGRRVSDALAAGGPRDPSIALELAAAEGDERALAALGDAALRVVDDGLRAAWLRGTTRGTRWLVAEKLKVQPKADPETRWLSLVFGRPTKTPDSACTHAPEEPWAEIGREDGSFATTTWRGAPTLEVITTLGCSGQAPVRLDVDGETLTANPSSPLAKWHVLVGGGRARARRLDSGDGRVFAIKPEAAACGAHFGFISAPKLAAQKPTFGFEKQVTAPGAEIWLREGSKGGTLEVISANDPKLRTSIVVTPHDGFVAVDGDGRRWVRVARVGLPPWAAAGSYAQGGDDLAVRGIVRAPKVKDDVAGQAFATASSAGDASAKEAEPLDEAKLIEASRQILATEAMAKGQKYLERALMLAAAGEVRAAIEDARAAAVLGTHGPKGEDPIEFVRVSLRPKPKKPLALPAGVRAYGIEPDFDPNAPRCGPSNGPRSLLAGVVKELDERKAAKAQTIWDARLAIRAYEAVEANTIDPRGPSVLSRALAGSRWEMPKTLSGDLLKVQRPHRVPKEGAIDPDGDLRARIGTGQPFDRASYATITETRPARAALTGLGGAKARVEFACVARSPAEVLSKEPRCPIAITIGTGAPLHPISGADGRGFVELPAVPPKGAGSYVTIALDPAPGRWAAIARLVFDREVPGSTQVEGVGWVLMPPGLQWRWLLKAEQDVVHAVSGPSLVRVDALPEPDESPKIVVIVSEAGEVGVKEMTVALDGTPTVVAVPKGGNVRVRAVSGTATIALAERVGKPAAPGLDDDEAEPVLADAADIGNADEPKGVTTKALLDGGDPSAAWADAVSKSDRPLTPFQEAFGTVAAHGLARVGTFREGDASLKERDAYLEQSIGYRRRIESIGVWTGVTGTLREHQEESSSWGVSAFVWTHIAPARLRIAAFGDAYGQDIGSVDGRTLRPRGYVEWSGRVSPSFYLLPRVGYDGYYTNIETRPSSLVGVDDDVFNDFRFRRPTLLYQQLMAWWVPYINDIFFLRARVNEDARRGLSHVSVRPGALFAFGNLELGGWADGTWFRETEGLRATSKVDVTGVGYALYNIWASAGSLDIQPGVGGRVRADDGGWEVYALVNIFGSYRRGVRDFASPELAFPEQFGGNVPWRGPVVGGMR